MRDATGSSNTSVFQKTLLQACSEVILKSNYALRRLIAPRLSSRAIAVVRSFNLNQPNTPRTTALCSAFIHSVQTKSNDSEAICVSVKRNTGERQFALHCTEQHRSNESMTTLLFNTSVRANHQHPRSRNHAKITQQIFVAATEFRAATRSSTSNQTHKR